MGINELSKLLRESNIRVSDLAELLGMAVTSLGVDLMMWLHICLHRGSEIVADFHCVPPVTLMHYFDDFLTSAKEFFDHYGIKIVLVCDGHQNPLKGATDADRKRDIAIALQKMRDIEQRRNIDDMDDYKKWKKRSMFIRDDIICYVMDWAKRHQVLVVGAPFEADYQLVQLEKENITQGTICEVIT
jgi:hypothetical protein